MQQGDKVTNHPSIHYYEMYGSTILCHVIGTELTHTPRTTDEWIKNMRDYEHNANWQIYEFAKPVIKNITKKCIPHLNHTITIIQGYCGSGKTQQAINTVKTYLYEGKKVLYLTTELTIQRMEERVHLFNQCPIFSTLIVKQFHNITQWIDFRYFLTLEKWDLIVLDSIDMFGDYNTVIEKFKTTSQICNCDVILTQQIQRQPNIHTTLRTF